MRTSAASSPTTFKKLTPDEQARTLDKLRRLETALLFTPEWDALGEQVADWRFAVRANMLGCDQVPEIAATLRRWGIR